MIFFQNYSILFSTYCSLFSAIEEIYLLLFLCKLGSQVFNQHMVFKLCIICMYYIYLLFYHILLHVYNVFYDYKMLNSPMSDWQLAQGVPVLLHTLLTKMPILCYINISTYKIEFCFSVISTSKAMLDISDNRNEFDSLYKSH